MAVALIAPAYLAFIWNAFRAKSLRCIKAEVETPKEMREIVSDRTGWQVLVFHDLSSTCTLLWFMRNALPSLFAVY